ncbi:MAG: type II toxin-antitoxin system prevent-host-death family antitoxin [Gemmatimonadaceae bacterium]|nr:type II toxin-antitoxin system prevent-host-death family antitoxin [Gemmatimonadaceae bacterium]
MTTATMHAAKTNLSRLIAEAEAGEEVVIMRGATPVVRLVPMGAGGTRARVFGALAGQVTVDASFFDPLPQAEFDAWEG